MASRLQQRRRDRKDKPRHIVSSPGEAVSTSPRAGREAILSEPPKASLGLRAATGDIYEVEAWLLWDHSSVIRELVEDSGPEEEIPLPSVSGEALGLLVDFCKATPRRVPAILRDVDIALLQELLWVARMLNMVALSSSVLRVVGQRLDAGVFGAAPFSCLPWRTLAELLRDEAVLSLPDGLSADLADAVVSRVPPGEEAAAVLALCAQAEHASSRNVCISVVRGLRALGTADATRGLCGLLLRPGPLGQNASRSLPRGSPAAIAALVEFADRKTDCFARQRAALGFGAVGGPDAISSLVLLLADDVREVRAAAVEAFGGEGLCGDPGAAAAVAALTAHDDARVQCSALDALAAVAPGSTLLEENASRLKASSSTATKNTATRILTTLKRKLEELEVGVESNIWEVTVASPARGGRMCWGDCEGDL